jgi:type I restriction enzyme S subunit
MPSDAKGQTVGDLVTLVRGTTYQGALVGKPGPALLGLGSIEPGGGFRADKFQSYGGDCPPELMLYPGDIYASLKGATKDGQMIGSVARVPRYIPSGRLTQDTVKLVFRDSDPMVASFLYWVLRTPQYRSYCAGHAVGSAVVALSRRDFLNYPVPERTEDRERAIGICDAIEDRIELNRRMNETLEAMARAIFKDWFVDFGPTRAKMEGREAYLAPDIWSLFPDRLDDEGKPEGWVGGHMSDLFVLQRGFDLPSHERVPGPYPVMAASGPNGFHNEYMVRAPGVTTGRSGVLGNVFYIQDDFWPLNTSLWIKEFRRATPSYAYFYLSTLDLESFNAGSAVPTLNRNHIHALPTVIPPTAIVSKFEKITVPLMQRQKCNAEEVVTLAATRDLLLPKLMSGELRIRDAEQIAGEAA